MSTLQTLTDAAAGNVGAIALLVPLLAPLIAAGVMALIPCHRVAATLNLLFSLLAFGAALVLLNDRPPGDMLLHLDDLNAALITLNTFVAFTSGLFSAGYIEHERQIGRIDPLTGRLHHVMYQALMFALNLAVLANNIALMWFGIELATLTAVMMVGIYRTPAALEAALKYFILGGVGVTLALFGTILIYFAAATDAKGGMEAMAWTALLIHADHFDPTLLNVAFIFLLLGYGTKAGLVPMHAWLPDAHAEGPTPITAVLSGLLINVSLYIILRFKMILTATPHTLPPGPLMISFGLVSVLFAALMLYRQRDIKRLFAYSSIEHMGIATLAFGIGGPLATFAGLLHMLMHSLTKSAIFFAVGHITQIKGTQQLAAIRGIGDSHPALGWGLAFAVLAIAGMPPFGVFMSEFLLINAAFAKTPALALLLIVALLVALGALLLRLNEVVFSEGERIPGEVHQNNGLLRASRSLPLVTHLLLVLAAGLYLPGPLVAWFQHVAARLG